MGRLNIYSDNYNGATVISNRFFDEYMKDANDAQLKVYLYLVRAINGDMNITISDIADKFNHTERDIIRSLKYWEKMHLLRLDYDDQKNIVGIHMEDLNKPSYGQVVTLQPKTATHQVVTNTINVAQAAAPAIQSTAPASVQKATTVATNESSSKKSSYTAADMERFASNEEFVQIRFVAETYLGKLLSGNELKSLLFIYDELKMSVELMDYLIEYCAGKDKRDLRYIEKVAMDWTDSGIKTVRQAKLRAGKYDKTVYAVMKSLGKNNTPTDTEATFIAKWMHQYCFSPDVISFACEKTVLATDSHRFEYADGILTRWHEEGLKTREQIQAKEQKYKHEKKTPVKPSATNNNRFNDFKQNNYDFATLEQELLSN